MLLTLCLLLALADSVRQDFTCASWPRVAAAATALEVNDGIPVLLEVMGQDTEVPLEDAADIVYPGARRFTGHGKRVDYELNWLPARAGWVLEGLTFETFGFRPADATPAEVLTAAGASARGRSLEELRVDPQVRAALRKRAVERARTWWKNQGERFDRLNAAGNALAGSDAARQFRVLEALRARRLPLQPFKDAVERLQHSQNEEVRKQADLLIR